MGSGSEGAPRRLRADDLDRAVPAIARAFAWHEPWGEWTLPDPATREAILTRVVEEDLRDRFLDHGECWTIDGASVSLWMPPEATALGRRRSECLCGLWRAGGAGARSG